MNDARPKLLPLVRFIFGCASLLITPFLLAQSVETSVTPERPTGHTFSDYGNIQSSQQQLILLNDKAPLPFSIFGSVQKWTTGPKQDNLITEVAQGLFKINEQWRAVASQLYQKQGSINLTNTVFGLNYRPNPNWSINSSVGAGTGYMYTYKYSLIFSPEYKLPILINEKRALSTSLGMNYQEFSLGGFSQIVPKINWHVSDYLPPVSIGYAFGSFKNSTSVTTNQYYQPKTINGAMLAASFRATQKSFVILSYYPYNHNIIGGRTLIQDTIGTTFNYKITDRMHISAFGQYQNSRASSIDLAFGGSVNFSF